VFETYVEMMNDDIKAVFQVSEGPRELAAVLSSVSSSRQGGSQEADLLIFDLTLFAWLPSPRSTTTPLPSATSPSFSRGSGLRTPAPVC
jgi:hypothetical protein